MKFWRWLRREEYRRSEWEKKFRRDTLDMLDRYGGW